MRLDRARHQITDDDAASFAVDDDKFEHFRAREHLDLAQADHPLQSLVCAQKKLLACLSSGIECARHLSAAKGTICQRAAVLACKRDALRDTLIDDVDGYLRQPVHVRLAGAE